MVDRTGEFVPPGAKPMVSSGDVPETLAFTDDPGREWMLAFQRGDEAAFDSIVLRYRSMVGRFIYRYVQDRERAEDICQEVFLRVFKARHRYRPEANFRTWLFTISVRLCLNELRARKRERRVIVRLHADPRSDGEAEDVLESVADRDVEPAGAAVERKEMEEAVDLAIADLPPSQRAALLLVRFEDFSYKEIAESLGITVMAVKSLINRGRERLRSSLSRFLKGD